MHTLITGGAGFIGSNLSRRLISEGYDVVVIDDLSTGLLSNIDQKRIEFHLVSFFLLNLTLSFDYSSAIKCDILDFETILRDTLLSNTIMCYTFLNKSL